MPQLPPIPMPLRAALGAVATVVDEARNLPDRAVELPMRAVSTAMKVGLQAQQRYAALAARGEQVLSGHRTTDEPPAWATFDDDLATAATEAFGTTEFGSAVQDDFVDLDTATSEQLDADDEPDADAVPSDGLASDGVIVNGAAPAEGIVDDGAGKTVRAPRTGPTSAFDDVEE